MLSKKLIQYCVLVHSFYHCIVWASIPYRFFIKLQVLMQTRSDKVRPKLLGLKVVRYMVQHLKEEYIVLLPETIPFLGELLEDVELPVKTLSQEILKEMETLSGENLRQYL